MARLRLRPPSPEQRGVPGRVFPALVMAVMTFAGWWLVVPRDWTDGEPWAEFVGACLIGGLLCWVASRARPEVGASVAIGGTGGIVAGSLIWSLIAEGDDLVPWPFVLLGVVLPTALLCCFGGVWVALRTSGAIGGPRPDEPPAHPGPSGGSDPPERPSPGG